MKATENAMMVKGGKGKGKKKKHPIHTSSGNLTNLNIECWNCGKKGNVRSKFSKKPKKKQFSNRGRIRICVPVKLMMTIPSH